MSRSHNFSRQAAADLDEAVGWLLDNGASASAAGELLAAVLIAAERLADHPGLGRRRLDLLPDPFRFWSIPRWKALLVYDPTDDPPKIMRVLNTARDLPPLLAGLRHDEP